MTKFFLVEWGCEEDFKLYGEKCSRITSPTRPLTGVYWAQSFVILKWLFYKNILCLSHPCHFSSQMCQIQVSSEKRFELAYHNYIQIRLALIQLLTVLPHETACHIIPSALHLITETLAVFGEVSQASLHWSRCWKHGLNMANGYISRLLLWNAFSAVLFTGRILPLGFIFWMKYRLDFQWFLLMHSWRSWRAWHCVSAHCHSAALWSTPLRNSSPIRGRPS